MVLLVIVPMVGVVQAVKLKTPVTTMGNIEILDVVMGVFVILVGVVIHVQRI